MKRILLVTLILVMAVSFAGCSKPQYTPPYNTNWISPGIVEVGNYYPGGRAEWELTIHNGNVENTKDSKNVTTEPYETEAWIPLKYKLFGDVSTIKLKSDLDEGLIIEKYDPDIGEVYINGFKDNSTRRLDFEYPRFTQFAITTNEPSHTMEGFEPISVFPLNWVVISDSNPVMLPGETRKIMVALDVPKGEVISFKKWEFWVSVTEDNKSGNQVVTELCSRWLVTMKQ